MVFVFQSQTRCQAPGDGHGSDTHKPSTRFHSQTRCQAPGDCPSPFALKISLFISISDEMPGPWRPGWQGYLRCNGWEFQSQTRCQAPGDSERNIGDQALI